MTRKRVFRVMIFGLPVAFFGFILLGIATLGCSCDPELYKESPLSELPERVLVNAGNQMPGYTPSRAWLVSRGDGVPYRVWVRGTSGYFSSKDVTVDLPKPDAPIDPELEPVDKNNR